MLLDPRGPRFAAAVTTLVLIAVLLTGSGWLALAQAAVFAATALSPRRGPYRPTELEPAAPVRFAQLVGLVFSLVAAVGYLAGEPVVGLVFAGFALVAAFLNAAFGLCLGCEVYLAFRRLTHRPIAPRVPAG